MPGGSLYSISLTIDEQSSISQSFFLPGFQYATPFLALLMSGEQSFLYLFYRKNYLRYIRHNHRVGGLVCPSSFPLLNQVVRNS